MGLLRRVALAVLIACAGGAAVAQDPQLGAVQSPILTLNEERLFSQTAFGKRALGEIAARQDALAAENRGFEAALAEEERSLTTLRATTDPAAFRALADAFDAKVGDVRRTQDAKARDLARQREVERQRFFDAAVPVLGEIARAAGAVAILSDQALILSFDRIDITDVAIARIDAALGDGSEPPPE